MQLLQKCIFIVCRCQCTCSGTRFVVYMAFLVWRAEMNGLSTLPFLAVVWCTTELRSWLFPHLWAEACLQGIADCHPISATYLMNRNKVYQIRFSEDLEPHECFFIWTVKKKLHSDNILRNYIKMSTAVTFKSALKYFFSYRLYG